MFFLVILNVPLILKGKEQDGRFKDVLGTTPMSCSKDAGQDRTCGEEPRL
jgi:hypothetical protein